MCEGCLAHQEWNNAVYDLIEQRKYKEQASGIPDFVFCGNCLSPRDVLQEPFVLVEKCEYCGDDEYLLFDEERGP
jgi:hypothetical protein